MIRKKLNLLLAAFAAISVYLLMLFMLSGGSFMSEYAIPICIVAITGIFLICGERAAIAAVMAAGFSAESLSGYPPGTLIISSACAGLVMSHASKLQSVSFPWRGAVICIAGTICWAGLLEAMQFMQPGNALLFFDALWSISSQAIFAATIWLTIITTYLGISSLFKQPRPIKIA